ncbi:MAG: protease inhibitor I42 family protein [Candidatus Eisenbacteria sp.]|nr:protease inhibitor I42 family protein [Candidatus Eisenbacteria bacterium]
MFRIGLLVVLAMLCLMIGCFPFGKGPGAARNIELTAGDDGRTIRMLEGGILIVALESNPSTGYTWEAVGIDEKILRRIGEKEWRQKPGTEGMMGAPGTMRIRFEAVGKGSANLKLVYHRPWEREKPEETFSIEVVVR